MAEDIDYYQEVGLDSDQVTELRKAFDSFDSEKKGAISSETTGELRVSRIISRLNDTQDKYCG